MTSENVMKVLISTMTHKPDEVYDFISCNYHLFSDFELRTILLEILFSLSDDEEIEEDTIKNAGYSLKEMQENDII